VPKTKSGGIELGERRGAVDSPIAPDFFAKTIQNIAGAIREGCYHAPSDSGYQVEEFLYKDVQVTPTICLQAIALFSTMSQRFPGHAVAISSLHPRFCSEYFLPLEI
jgi:hypothetical protein